MRKSILNLFVSLFIIFLFTTCKPLPPATLPDKRDCTFTIAEPEKYDCFVNHQATGVPTTKIKLSIFFKTRYVNGSNSGTPFIDCDEKTISFDPSVSSFPLTVVVKAPVSGLWECIVIIQGTQCAECANTYGDTKEASGNCVAYAYTTTSPPTYQAAKPQWDGGRGFRDNAIVQMVPAAKRVSNVLSTCNDNCKIN